MTLDTNKFTIVDHFVYNEPQKKKTSVTILLRRSTMCSPKVVHGHVVNSESLPGLEKNLGF